jgi:hypothetical protein
LESTFVKTRTVSGVDLGPDCFAFVGNPVDPQTWKLPVHFPGDGEKTINHIKNGLYRFAYTQIPDAERADTWRTLAGAAKAHGIKVGPQPASAGPVPAHPETAKAMDTLDSEVKAAVALASLAAERLLKTMGY